MAEETESGIFGWDLLYALYKKNFTSKLNFVVVWTHFNLIRRGLKNAGIGEDFTLPAQKDLKETLPIGWHDQKPCRLRYFFNKKLYFLAIQPIDDDGDIVINCTRPCDNYCAVSSINIDEIINLAGRLEEIMPTWAIIMQRITDELIDPLLQNEASKDIEVQTDPYEEDRESQPTGVYHAPPEMPIPVPPRFNFVPPVGVGSADLNPLGGGGGMLFQPPGMGPRPFMPDPFLPPGSLPPGARFDPIMPGGPGNFPPMPDGSRPRPMPRREYPDPDHLPPPGYDDMFS